MRGVIALALIAVFLALTIGAIVGLLVAGKFLLSTLGDVRGRGVIAVVVLGLACFAAAGVIAWSVLPRIDRFEPPGPEVTAADQPELFAMIREVAAATAQPLPAHVYLVHDVNAFVAQRGGVLGFGSRRVMGVGLPLARALTVSELRAVIAHEMGHFHGGDTRLGPFIYKTRGAILRTVDNLARAHDAAAEVGSVALVFRALRAPFVWFAHGYLRITLAISRAQEYGADAIAARTEGADAAIRGLEKTHGAALAHSSYLQTEVAPLVDRGALPPIGQGFARFLDHAELREKLAAALAAELREGKSAPYDSHPALRDRITAIEARRGATPERALDDRPAIALFHDADRLENEIVESLAGRALRPIEWAAASSEWVAVWREDARQYARDLAGITPATIPHRDLSSLARKLLPDHVAMHVITTEQQAPWATSVFAPVLATLLVESGYEPDVVIGEPFRFRRGDDEVRIEEIGDFLAGKIEPVEWKARWERRGLADADLGAVARRTPRVTDEASARTG